MIDGRLHASVKGRNETATATKSYDTGDSLEEDANSQWFPFYDMCVLDSPWWPDDLDATPTPPVAVTLTAARVKQVRGV